MKICKGLCFMTVKGNEHEEMSKLCMGKTRMALRTARIIKEEDPDNAVTLAYYGMFHAAHGALLAEGVLSVKSHEEVNNKFSEIFVRTGKLPREIFNMMEEAWRDHHKAEYDPKVKFSLQEANKHIENADEFWGNVEKLTAGKEVQSFREREADSKRQKRLAELDEDLQHSKNKFSPGTMEFQAQYNKANEIFRLEKERGTDDEEAKRRHPEAVAVLIQAVAHQARNR